MLAASSLVTLESFGKFSRGPTERSNLIATPRETAAKFSAARASPFAWSHEFLEHRFTAPILDPESELCASQTIGSDMHEVDASLVSATPPAACALRRHVTSFLARWCRLARREASCVQDGTLQFGSRKESTQAKARSATLQGGAGQICRAVDLGRSAVIEWSLDRLDLSAPSLLPRHTRLLVVMRLNVTGYSLKVARNEVENASFAQRSAHRDSRIWRPELIEPAAERKRRTRADDDRRSNRPTPTHRFCHSAILRAITPYKVWFFWVRRHRSIILAKKWKHFRADFEKFQEMC